MRTLPLLLIVLAVCGFASAQAPQPVADRLAAQNALFDEQYETDLRDFPERATATTTSLRTTHSPPSTSDMKPTNPTSPG